jgi:Uncharacterized conserved protein (DUF2278)
MPLARYGVAIGTFVSFARDPQDQFGRWYHGHVTIATPVGQYQSALDVDTPSGIGVSYRISPSLPQQALGPVAAMPDGWHPLASSPASGALDYLRSPVFEDAVIRWPLPQHPPQLRGMPSAASPAVAGRAGSLRDRLLHQLGRVAQRLPERAVRFRPWIRSTGNNALSALEAELPRSSRVYLFGEHYEHGGLGVHDVHMNQGDPPGSQWWSGDGVWQDGAVLIHRKDRRLFAWQVKFNSQAMHTDASGHPV